MKIDKKTVKRLQELAGLVNEARDPMAVVKVSQMFIDRNITELEQGTEEWIYLVAEVYNKYCKKPNEPNIDPEDLFIHSDRYNLKEAVQIIELAADDAEVDIY